MINYPLPRLDKDKVLYSFILDFCRLEKGESWIDPLKRHKIACIDCADKAAIKTFAGRNKFTLAVHDPPYNMIAFKKSRAVEFVEWCKDWIEITDNLLSDNSSMYIWLGADQKHHFEPFAEFIVMMKDSGFKSKSFITMRNQRGYGTQKNWMSIRQELLYYVKGNPVFNSNAVHTEIPKRVKGYYKNIKGKRTENIERSRSDKLRAGNVWVDVQQVFHLMDENVNGCFAQKPLKSIQRIVNVSSNKGDRILDFFSHSGTTLLAAERSDRKCHTIDIDPVFCEISIRRLEHYRRTGRLGWQNSNPFSEEIMSDKKIKKHLKDKYNIVYSDN